MNEIEIWKDIEGFECIYQVSNFGSICKIKNNNKIILNTTKPNKNGYKRVTIKNKVYDIHRLVACTFLQNPNNYLFVKHKDTNKLNNVASNLYWTSIRVEGKEKSISTYQKIENLDIIKWIGDNHNCVIYKFENIINNKFYIGSAKDFYKRVSCHISSLKRGAHGNSYLQYSWNKYGSGNFKFSIVEECEINNRLDREQYFIDTLKPEYNLSLIAGGGMQSELFTSEVRNKMSKASKRMWTSEGHVEKMSKICTERWNNPIYRNKFQKKVIQLSLTGEVIKEYNSVREAAIEVGLKIPSSISGCCKGKRKTAAGYLWKYKNN